jgi:hypothetical protein
MGLMLGFVGFRWILHEDQRLAHALLYCLIRG